MVERGSATPCFVTRPRIWLQCAGIWGEFRKKYSKARHDKVAVLSDEHYATGALTSTMATLSSETIMERLSSVLPKARILIVIRHQAHILMAQYQNELKIRRT